MTKRQLEPIPTAEGRKLETHEEFREIRTLLQRHLVIRTPQGQKSLEIFEVEPFAEMLTPDDQRTFNSKPRARGEIIVLWRRGTPMLNVVVNPNQESVVCIKTCKIDGKEISANQVLTMMGFEAETYGGYKGFRPARTTESDGQQSVSNNPDAKIRIEELAETAGAVLNIRRNVAARTAANSLGVFVNADRV
ncbi:MAG: hypothetical protein O3B47_01225 [bacterium]|nr:hypothetical protein [bacterium]